MKKFQYHPDILTKYQTLQAGVIVANNLQNRPSSGTLKGVYFQEQQENLARTQAPLSEIPSLIAWRQAFRQFGTNPTKYRSAAEALLRRLTKKGDIPSINTLVDIGNLVSIRYALPVAILDTRGVVGPITVHFSDGTERFRELGQTEAIHPEMGEVVFSDTTGMVVARRWCWRQSAESAARMDTTNVIVTVEAHHDTAEADVGNAVTDLVALMSEYAGGTYNHTVLNANQLAI